LFHLWKWIRRRSPRRLRLTDLKASFEPKLTERHKIFRAFLCGTLCGVLLAAAVTFTLAIPANNIHWQVEITKRGGGDWYFDKNGHYGWMWTVEPIPERKRSKPAIIPAAQKKISPGHP
jgi:hypothetical protein